MQVCVLKLKPLADAPLPAPPSTLPFACLLLQVALSEREKKLLALIQKQDRLLYICFYMLLNLSEDVEVERKMKKKVGWREGRVGGSRRSRAFGGVRGWQDGAGGTGQ